MKNKTLNLILAIGVLLNLSSCNQEQVLNGIKNVAPKSLKGDFAIANNLSDFLALPSQGTVYLRANKIGNQPFVYSGQAFFLDQNKQLQKMQDITIGDLSYLANPHVNNQYDLYSTAITPEAQITVKTVAANCFGKTVGVKATGTDGKDLIKASMYIPKEVILNNIADEGSIRTGNNTLELNWNADTQNEKGVFIKIDKWQPDETQPKYIWVTDNGTYSLNIDELAAYKNRDNIALVSVIRGNYALINDCKVFVISQASCPIKIMAK